MSPLLIGLALLAASERPKLVVLDLGAAGGVEREVAGALSEAITSEVAARGYFEVISSREMATMLGIERQRQILGGAECGEDATNCLADLAGALGARFVLAGTLARLGDAFQLSLQTMDTSRAKPLGRSVRLARDLVALRRSLPHAVAEATATPLPLPPSRLWPNVTTAAGGLALVAGGLLGMDALGQERSISDELRRGETEQGVLRGADHYRQRARAIGAQKTASLAGLAVGAALIGVGIHWNLELSREGAVTSFAVLPTGSGVAVAGVFQ